MLAWTLKLLFIFYAPATYNVHIQCIMKVDNHMLYSLVLAIHIDCRNITHIIKSLTCLLNPHTEVLILKYCDNKNPCVVHIRKLYS